MILRRRQIATLVNLVALLLISSFPASACTICSDAMVWKIFPPILIWAWIGVAWFLALAVLSAIGKERIPYLPRIRISIILVVLGSLVPFAFGLTIVLPFLGFALLSFIWILRKRRDYSPSFAIMTYTISLFSLAVMAITGIYEIISPTPRMPLNVILRWDGTVPSRVALDELKNEEPESAAVYREILKCALMPGDIPSTRWAWPYGVRKPNLSTVARVATRLSAIGDPAIDVPLLIETLQAARSVPENIFAEEIEEVLGTMTRISLSTGTSTEEWKVAWREEQSKKFMDRDP